jgi:hypothetical protein
VTRRKSPGWPVALSAVTETVVTTRGPNDRWNVAALGVHAPEERDAGGDRATATTWGRTRTWRNFHERGRGHVQFVTDPELFVRAAVTVHEVDDPVLAAAWAWVAVEVESLATGTEGETEWERWALAPTDAAVERETVPTLSRGRMAVVEATVAASRLDVPSYDAADLRERLDWLASVVDAAGDDADHRALEVLAANVDWDRPTDNEE